MYSPRKGESIEQEASVVALSLSVQVTGRASPLTHNRHCTHYGQELHWQISIPEHRFSQLPMHRTFSLSPNTLPLVSGKATSTVVPVKPEVSFMPSQRPNQSRFGSCYKNNCSPCTRSIQLLQQPALTQLMERRNGNVSLYWLQKSAFNSIWELVPIYWVYLVHQPLIP